MKMTDVPDVEGPKFLSTLDGEISEFESWMKTNLNGGLSSMEKTILRTYIAWKIAPDRFKG